MSIKKDNIKKIIKKITKSHLFTKILGVAFYFYSYIVYKTCKWDIINREIIINKLEKKENIILLIWHGRAMMIPAFSDKKYSMNALVSLHNDGQIIAELLKRYNIGVIGGSTSNNAKGAAIALMNSLKNNTSITIIPDGPRGPRMHMGMSPIFYAQKTGTPIICATYSTKRGKIVEKAWDKMLLPIPFDKGCVTFSEPIFIPQNITQEQQEDYRISVEATLNKISIDADKKMGRTPVLPATKEEIAKSKKRKIINVY